MAGASQQAGTHTMHTRTEEEEEGADIRHSLANKSIARQSQRLDLQSASFSQ